jgi:hypothetical protein
MDEPSCSFLLDNCPRELRGHHALGSCGAGSEAGYARRFVLAVLGVILESLTIIRYVVAAPPVAWIPGP